MSDTLSGVGVVDKVVAVLDAVAAAPQSLAALMAATSLPRATAHRTATALEAHRLLARDRQGRWVVGPRWVELTGAGAGDGDLAAVAQPILDALRDATGESAQVFVRRGDSRICTAASDRRAGLRDTVPVGAVLPMTAGSSAKVLLAWADVVERRRLLPGAVYEDRDLADVRRRGWATSLGEREPGVASVSAPVRRGADVVAALCVSGPADRLGRVPGRRLAGPVTSAADELTAALGR